MNLRKWFTDRGLRVVIKRAASLVNRYGITPNKAMARIDDVMAILARFDYAPTFPTPGFVVQRYPEFFQRIQAAGAEIAVHSYQHIDLNSIPLDQSIEQLKRAMDTFAHYGIEAYGFRCPYLSFSDELLEALPEGMLGYSSNRSIWLEVPSIARNNEHSVFFNTLQKFYKPKPFAEFVSLPSTYPNLVEIPVCVPDDLQLFDGLKFDSKGISQAWIEMLLHTHQRGELFNLIFHPELGSICLQSFQDLFQKAISLKPDVWFSRLRDVHDWWREKAQFDVDIDITSNELTIKFNCSNRATILARGLQIDNKGQNWDDGYIVVKTPYLKVSAIPRPFIGLAKDVPNNVVAFLHEQGYILDISQDAVNCGIYLNADKLAVLNNEVQLVQSIEKSQEPLIRYWPWPNGARSALCISGDLDAVSLMDYVARLVER